MGERVHPYVEGTPLQYPSVEGTPLQYPSAPSYEQHANQYQHGVEIPDKVIHKEQQQTLLSNQVVPNGVESSNEEDPFAPVQQLPLPLAQRRHRGRRCALRCCCCVGACVGTIVLMIGIIVLVLFLVLHPKLPKYTITQAYISQFSIRNSTSSGSSGVAAISDAEEQGEQTLYLNADMEFMVRMRNPNKRIGIYYRDIKAAMYYEGVEIGEGSIPGFYQGHKNTTYVGLDMKGRDVELTPELGATLRASLKNDDSLTVQARAITHVRLKLGRWKLHASKVRVKCHIEISNPTRGNVRLLHNSCKFKLLRFRL